MLMEMDRMLLDAILWKCPNCGSEWLIDEVGGDWEENGCPGCPPEEDEVSLIKGVNCDCEMCNLRR